MVPMELMKKTRLLHSLSLCWRINVNLCELFLAGLCHATASVLCSSAEFVRKEIHLQIVPGQALVRLRFPLAGLVELQRILFQEEQAAFGHPIEKALRMGRFIH